MIQHHQGYYNQLAAAMVRGKLASKAQDSPLFTKPLADLTPEEISALIQIGLEEGVSLHLLRKALEESYVTKLMGYLRGIQPDNLLDFGHGDKLFMWRLLDEFRFLPVVSADIDGQYDSEVKAVHDGGFTNLKGRQYKLEDIDAHILEKQKRNLHRNQFDVVTALNVMQQVEDIKDALIRLTAITKRFLIISYSKEDAAKNKNLNPTVIKEVVMSQDILQFKVDELDTHINIIARK